MASKMDDKFKDLRERAAALINFTEGTSSEPQKNSVKQLVEYEPLKDPIDKTKGGFSL